MNAESKPVVRRLETFRGWQVPATTLVPIILAILVALGIIAGFILWATSDIDRRGMERERRLVSRVVAQKIAQVPRDQESVAIWDDAVIHTRKPVDSAWIDVNLGSWMYDYFGHDRVFLLDASNRPFYAMDAGAAVDASAYAEAMQAIVPLIRKIRGKLASGELAAYATEAGAAYPMVVDILRIDGTPAIVSVVPVAPDSSAVAQPEPGTEILHVSMVFLTDALAARLGEQYQLEGMHFMTASPGPADGTARYPIVDADGRFAAFLEWRPDAPGQIILSRTAPAMAVGFIIAGIVVFFLLDQLWRSSAALREGRRIAHHQANHDALTGLPNRARFEAFLAEALAARSGREDTVSLMMLDLDRFKQVNDTLGHQAGDDLIRGVAQRLQEIVGNRDLLARWGGDEFGLVHIGRGGEREMQVLGMRIIEAVSKPFDIFGSEAFVGVSIGVAVAGSDTDRLELIRKADIALHEAKASGRGRTVLFEEAMSDLLRGRHTIASELREALKTRDQLSVAYQPLFWRETGRISGAEALARWRHPVLGEVSPAHFIPVAESTGLIEELGDFVLATVCELGARWPGAKLAINISPTQLRNPRFPSRVFELLERAGMRAEDLELEITEGILLEEAHVITEALATFRHAGIRIALDDFGTGYSSLNYLKRYPVDRIKIDRSFVSQLAAGSVSLPIVQAMVTLAHALGIAVTAEGVETHEQMAILAEMGCDSLQGFLLSPPVSAAAAEDMFRRHRTALSKSPAAA